MKDEINKNDETIELLSIDDEIKANYDDVKEILNDNIKNKEENLNDLELGIIGLMPEKLKREIIFKNSIEDDVKYDELKKHLQEKTILRARVFAIEIDKDNKLVGVIADFNGVRVCIPHNVYLMNSYNMPKHYESANEEEKLDILVDVLKYQIGAIVCFTIMAISKDENGENIIIGNRVEAMYAIQKQVFGAKEDLSDAKVKIDDMVDAFVLSVTNNGLMVECLGVETRIGRRDLFNEDTIFNCKDYYNPGDVIKVRIKRMYNQNDKDKNSIYLTVSGRIVKKPNEITHMKVGSIYKGKIDKYYKNKDLYTVRLDNNVIAKVFGDHVTQFKKLCEGDIVCVKVMKMSDDFVKGYITFVY